MLLEKLARAIACKGCELRAAFAASEEQVTEQTREILRLNRVLSDAKREREETKLKNDQLEIALETIKAKSCDNCGKKCRVKPKGEVLMRYNCHLWQPRPEVQDESHGGDVNHERSTV